VSNATRAALAITLKQTKGRWTVYFKCQGCGRKIRKLGQGRVFFTGSWLSICHAKFDCQKEIKTGTDWMSLQGIFDGLLSGLGILQFTVQPPLVDDAVTGTISGSRVKEISGLVISLGTNPRSSRKRTRKKRRSVARRDLQGSGKPRPHSRIRRK